MNSKACTFKYNLNNDFKLNRLYTRKSTSILYSFFAALFSWENNLSTELTKLTYKKK